MFVHLLGNIMLERRRRAAEAVAAGAALFGGAPNAAPGGCGGLRRSHQRLRERPTERLLGGRERAAVAAGVWTTSGSRGAFLWGMCMGIMEI